MRRLAALVLVGFLVFTLVSSLSASEEDDEQQQTDQEALLATLSLMCGGSLGGQAAVPSTAAIDDVAAQPASAASPLCLGLFGGGDGCRGVDAGEVLERTRDLGDSSGIPAEAFAAYCAAATAFEIDWALLAAIGWVECRHGRYRGAGCHPEGSVNEAGARGPMQFLGSTWRSSAGTFDSDVAGPPVCRRAGEAEVVAATECERVAGYGTDGGGDGEADPWDWSDATYSAARYLVASGVRDDVVGAVYAYNHDRSYVGTVQAMAADYRRVTADLMRASAAVSGGRTTRTAAGTTISVVGMRDSRGEPIKDTHGRPVEVNSDIASGVQALFLAAEADPGLDGDLVVVSSFRDAATQIRLWNDCNASCRARGMVAQPGRSMHEQGRAIDFGCGNGGLMGRGNVCYEWLVDNAPRYGLRELCAGHEPWHWSDNCR